jgi:cell fate (sporulation/competence/biofilm development) regulator YmcA (YheA/YmcA/DUF963 family)
LSEDLAKALQTALSKIAALEEKVSGKPAAPQVPQFDPTEVIKNPIAFFQKHGVPLDHVGKYVIAHQLGDAAPDGIKAYVQMGQQVSATHELQSKFDTLRRDVEQVVGATKREKFNALIANQGQYPHLAAAIAADPTLVGEVQGDPAEHAAKLEAKFATIAAAVRPHSASAENAGTTVAEGQAKPAQVAGQPPVVKVPDGPLDAEGKRALRDAVIAEHAAKRQK